MREDKIGTGREKRREEQSEVEEGGTGRRKRREEQGDEAEVGAA